MEPLSAYLYSRVIPASSLVLLNISIGQRGDFFHLFFLGKSSFSFGLDLKTDPHPGDIYIEVIVIKKKSHSRKCYYSSARILVPSEV